MVVKVDMSADGIIDEMLKPQESARLAELAAALGNIFKGLEPSARRGAEPSKILPQLRIEADARKTAARQARAVVRKHAAGTFADEGGVATLRDLLRDDIESTLSILQRAPHAIGPLRGFQAPQWVFDWLLPWRFVRETAYRRRDALVPAIRASVEAGQASSKAEKTASEYDRTHSDNIGSFYILEIWRTRLSPLAKGITSDMLFCHAHDLALQIPGAELRHCKDPAFHLLMVEQLGRKARFDALVAARPSGGIWGKAALLHFSQAAACWNENREAYENKFAESDTDPEVLPFADQGMTWARIAMADMIATAAVIRADDAMRHEAQQDTSGSGSLLAQVNAFWKDHVEAHKRHGGDGGAGAEAAITTWSSKTADKVGDARGVWGGYSGGSVLGD